MSLNFINNFSETIKSGNLSSVISQKLSESSITTLIGGVRKVYLDLRERNNYSDSLASFWEMVSPYIDGEKIVDLQDSISAGTYEYKAVYSELDIDPTDVSDFLKDLLDSDVNDSGACVFSDSDGNVYDVIDGDALSDTDWADQDVSITNVLAAYKSAPKDLNDCFMYINEHGKVCMNLMMRSVEYADEIVDEQVVVTSGHTSDVFSVLKSKFESTAINDVLCDACEFIIAGKTNVTDLVSTVNAKYSNICSAGKKTMNKCVEAYNSYGLKGLAVLICKLYSIQSTFVESDGVMVFTDNESLAPAEYVAGTVLSFLTTVVSVAAYIVLGCNRVLGAVLLALGAIVSFIAKAVSFDWSQTRCGVNLEDAVLPITPYGICQTTISISSLTNDVREIISNMLSVFGVASAPTVGGWWLFGYGNADRTTLNIEFHPSCLPLDPSQSQSYLDWAGKTTGSGQLHTWTTTSGSTTLLWADSGSLYLPTRDQLAQQYVEMVQPLPDWYFGDIDGNSTASADLDEEIRRNVTRNLIAFLTYCFSAGKTNTGLDRVSISYTGGYLIGEFISSGDDYGFILPDAYNNNFYSILLPFVLYSMGVNVFQRLDGFSWQVLTNIVNRYAIRQYSTDSGNWYKYMYYQDDPTATVIGTLEYSARSGVWTWPCIQYDLQTPYVGDVQPINDFKNYMIALPSYNASSFWTALVATGIIAVALTVATVVTVVAVKKQIQMKRAQNQAAIEHAWSEYVNDPSSSNLKQFRSAVTKNNMQAMVIGGTKYSKENYWASSSDTTATSGAASFMSVLDSDTTNDCSSYCTDILRAIYLKITGSEYISN